MKQGWHSKLYRDARDISVEAQQLASDICGGVVPSRSMYICWEHCRPIVGAGYSYCYEGAKEAINEENQNHLQSC